MKGAKGANCKESARIKEHVAQAEITALNAENEELEESMCSLKAENQKLKENSPKPSVIKELEAQVTALKQEVAKVKAENDELKQEVAELKKKPSAYRDLQKKCKELGLKAVGKREVLEQRIQDHEQQAQD
eukprot:COSAG06_NODE_12895_length_1314_cov_12.460082_2_plen_131_part_00